MKRLKKFYGKLKAKGRSKHLMSKGNFYILILKLRSASVRLNLLVLFGFALILFFSASVFFQTSEISAQNQIKVQSVSQAPFRIGERLTYNVSFEQYDNAAFAEIYVVSRGKLGERDAIELRSKIKTVDLVSAFYPLDEARTTFVSAETNLPLYIRKISNAAVLPKETVSNYTVAPAVYNDLLTFIYQARTAGGTGNFTFQEEEKIYNVSLQSAVKNKNSIRETLKTDAGEYETTISTVQSDYLIEKGINDLRINFSNDPARIPVLFRFKTAKGDFRAEVASVQYIEPEISAEPTLPTPAQTPRPQATPKPVPTATPYIENEPLSTDLPFVLGEALEYQVSTSGQMLAIVTLQAKERKQVLEQDSLLLTATATGTEPNQRTFVLGDGIRAQVSPDSIAPRQIDLKFAGLLSPYNLTAQFNQKAGFVTFNGANRAEVPVGTHSILSLAYAIRAFNLKPSKDTSNPVNDTRVAVFIDSKAYVVTLRPSDGEIINLRGEKISAQLITIRTGNPVFDQNNLRLWLGNTEKRLPLRLSFGNFQADLISEKQIPPK